MQTPVRKRMKPTPEGLVWFVLRVRSQKELLAKVALQRMGFHVKVPPRSAWRAVNHYTAARRDKKLKLFPLLTSYLFVGFRADWCQKDEILFNTMYKARSPHFVYKFLAINGYPFQIPDDWIEALETGPEAIAKLYQRRMRSGEEFLIGDPIRIVEGPFAGFESVVEDVDDDGTFATVILEVFGRTMGVTIPAHTAVKKKAA